MLLLMGRKAAFFDLDGTIAIENNSPAQEVVSAIRLFRAQGNPIFLCTGRATSHIYESVAAIGFDGVVAGAGAFVSVGEKVLYNRLMEPPLLRRIIAFFLQNGHTCLLEGEKSLYAVNPRSGLDGMWPEITDPDAFLPKTGPYAGQGIFKFTAYGEVAETARRFLAREMTVIDHESYIEVIPAGCSKADGMRRALKAMGMRREDSIAFGDSRNDIDMLEYAGLGIAMGDSPEPVQRAADYVTAPLAENGVARALSAILNNTL